MAGAGLRVVETLVRMLGRAATQVAKALVRWFLQVGTLTARMLTHVRDHLARAGGAAPGPNLVDRSVATLMGLAVYCITVLVLVGCVTAATAILGTTWWAVALAVIVAALGHLFTRILVRGVVAPRRLSANIASALLGGTFVFLPIGLLFGGAVATETVGPAIDAARRAEVDARPEFVSIGTLSGRVNDLQASIDSPPTPSVADDPDVQRQQQLVDRAYDVLVQTEKDQVDEVKGKLGSGPGRGGGYREREAAIRRLQEDYDGLLAKRDDLQETARSQAVAAQVKRDTESRDVARAQRDDLVVRRDNARRDARAADNSPGSPADRFFFALTSLPGQPPAGHRVLVVAVSVTALQMAVVLLRLLCGPSSVASTADQTAYLLGAARRRRAAAQRRGRAAGRVETSSDVPSQRAQADARATQ